MSLADALSPVVLAWSVIALIVVATVLHRIERKIQIMSIASAQLVVNAQALQSAVNQLVAQAGTPVPATTDTAETIADVATVAGILSSVTTSIESLITPTSTASSAQNTQSAGITTQGNGTAGNLPSS